MLKNTLRIPPHFFLYNVMHKFYVCCRVTALIVATFFLRLVYTHNKTVYNYTTNNECMYCDKHEGNEKFMRIKKKLSCKFLYVLNFLSSFENLNFLYFLIPWKSFHWFLHISSFKWIILSHITSIKCKDFDVIFYSSIIKGEREKQRNAFIAKKERRHASDTKRYLHWI